MTMLERVARAMWEKRRENAKDWMPEMPLEEWGDGSIPRANGIFDEAQAAIDVMLAEQP